MYAVIAAAASVDVSARSPRMCRSSSRENARGRSVSMNFSVAAPGLEADLDEDARALLDVVAGGLDEPRHLAQLGHDPAGALGLRRVGEERLAGEAGADDVGVDLGVALPGPDRLELVHPRFDVGGDDRMLDLLDAASRCRRIDLVEAAAEPGQRADVGVDRRPAQSSSRSSCRWTPSRLAWLGSTSCRYAR